MSLKQQDIDRAFSKLQMEVRNSGDKLAWFIYKGKKIIFTKRSFGSGKLDGNIPSMIRQKLKLNEHNFNLLIKCPLKRDNYINILKDKGII